MGDFDDAIAILREHQLKARAMFVAYDNADDMHTSKGLDEAIEILSNAKKSDIIPLEDIVRQAIKDAEELGDVALIWDGVDFEEVE